MNDLFAKHRHNTEIIITVWQEQKDSRSCSYIRHEKKTDKMFYRRMYSVVRLAVKDEYRHVQCIGSTSLYFFVSLFFDVCLGALM